MTGSHLPDELSGAQRAVARLFFGLPESEGFLLAGGTALLAMDYIHRATHDVDLFATGDAVTHARDAFASAVADHGGEVRSIVDRSTFCRLHLLLDGEDVLVDLAIDTAPVRPPVATPIGPTFAPEELAGRKLLALFDRAEARDFADVRALARRFGQDVLVERAAEIDAGLDRSVLAEMMGAIARFDDGELPVDDPDELRRYFAVWRDRLR